MQAFGFKAEFLVKGNCVDVGFSHRQLDAGKPGCESCVDRPLPAGRAPEYLKRPSKTLHLNPYDPRVCAAAARSALASRRQFRVKEI